MPQKFKHNFITLTDSYKQCHHKLIDKGTEYVFSYDESRGGDYEDLVSIGLQFILKSYFTGVVFSKNDIIKAAKRCEMHFGTSDIFNEEGWNKLYDKYQGKLPIRINAFREGTIFPTHMPFLTVESTDPEFVWLANFVESLLLTVWYPMTVASQSLYIYKMIKNFANKTGCTNIDFHLHNFGFRGTSSVESNCIGDLAHSIIFKGSDTMVGMDTAEQFYNYDGSSTYSVFATEHSETIIFGKNRELDFYKQLLAEVPNGIVSCVVDTYDMEYAVDELLGKQLRQEILNRNGKFVFRPDSGNPVEMSVYVLNSLWKNFGGTINEKGYKVLDPHVGVIYGDGINRRSIFDILKAVWNEGFCISNIVFGMGGALSQIVNRDMSRYAFKTSFAIVNGKERAVRKEVITDPTKSSKAGLLKVIKTFDHDGKFIYRTVSSEDKDYTRDEFNKLENCLVPIFENGELLIDEKYEDIINRKNEHLKNLGVL